MTVRILIIGGSGQLGWELRRALSPLAEVVSTGRDQLDLADPDAVRTCVRTVAPRLVVNAGAYTAVDRAETESHLAEMVNHWAPAVLAEECHPCRDQPVSPNNPKGLFILSGRFSNGYAFSASRGDVVRECHAPL